jgi:hypothetical protein
MRDIAQLAREFHISLAKAPGMTRCASWKPGEAGGGAVRRMRTSLRYPIPACRSGSEKAAPLGKSGGAGLLVGVAILEVALRWKVVVDRGMD